MRRSNPSWPRSPAARKRDAYRRRYDKNPSRRTYQQDRARHNTGRDLGPAIAEGRPFADDLTRCEVKWLRLMAGARFTDVRGVKGVLVHYEPGLVGGRDIARI